MHKAHLQSPEPQKENPQYSDNKHNRLPVLKNAQNLDPKITLWNVPSQVHTWKHSPDLPDPHMKTCPPNLSGSHKTSPVTPTRSAFENSVRTQTKLVALCPVDEPRTILASVWARKSCNTWYKKQSTLKTNYSTFLLSIICRNTHNIEKQENPSPHHSIISHKSPPANFDLSQRLPQHSQRWCLVFLRHILLPHLKTNPFTRVPNSLPIASAQTLSLVRNLIRPEINTALVTRPPEPSVRRDLAWNKTLLPQKMNMKEKLPASPEKATTENPNIQISKYPNIAKLMASITNKKLMTMKSSPHSKSWKNLQCIQTSDLSPPLQKLLSITCKQSTLPNRKWK